MFLPRSVTLHPRDFKKRGHQINNMSGLVDDLTMVLDLVRPMSNQRRCNPTLMNPGFVSSERRVASRRPARA